MKHPAENFIKFLIIKGMAQTQQSTNFIQADGSMEVIAPGAAASPVTDSQIMKSLDDWGFLQPEASYLGLLRQSIPAPPANFVPLDRLNRPSTQYIREHNVYNLFYPDDAMNEAWEILALPKVRQIVEQILMARCVNRPALKLINEKHKLKMTVDGVSCFGHYFWNVDLLSFDQWGRYLYDRSAMYPDYMALLRAPPSLLFFKLQIEQQMESKDMIKKAQDIAYHNLTQVNLIPGTDSAKVKAIGVLTKSVVDCDVALSASDAALSGVLKRFEQFRMVHPQTPAPDIKQLAPQSNFSGSGISQDTKEKVPV